MILGIDIGGTNTKVGLFKDEKIVEKWQFKTNINDIFGNIKQNLNSLNWDEITSVGISMPGFIDHERNIVTLSGNLNLKNYDVPKAFNKVFNFKNVYVINDANAAALGEYWKGSGTKYKSIVFYTIGTGIGGGVIINNNLIYGQNGYAGELGHGGNFQNKWPCSCGLKHCIEPVSSASGIERALREENINQTIKQVADEFKRGDKKIVSIFRQALTPLAYHIATMETALNPEAIIIGGGPSALGKPLVDLITSLVDENQHQFISHRTPILLATTKNDAGIFGAAYWAWKHISEKVNHENNDC